MQSKSIIRHIRAGDYRFLLISEIQRLLIAARQEEELAIGNDYVGREITFLIQRLSLEEAATELKKVAEAAVTALPTLQALASTANTLAQHVQIASNCTELLNLTTEAYNLFNVSAAPDDGDSIVVSADADAVTIKIQDSEVDPHLQGLQPKDLLSEAVKASHTDKQFLAAVIRQMATIRTLRRKMFWNERIALAAGYHVLESGAAIPPAFRPIGTSGFRPHQTCLSLADPGDGHMSVTCLDNRLLNGTVVHVEHIDRSESNDRESVEAYRLPSFINAARVRLQVGVATPCTAYIGRSLFENGASAAEGQSALLATEFDRDILKSVHMTAGACTAMFNIGIADCKVAMERMTAQQLIRFMRAVSGNVLRDVSRQFLSAAFNINVPIFDDRKRSVWVTDKFEIAHLAIELTIVGQFEKVTWDGASSLAKSDPIILAFTHSQWLTLTHYAHEKGLETYVSAGMDGSHMTACVLTGVDGVGIGTSLHYRKAGRPMGQLKPEAIGQVLATRDAAAASIPGQATALLAALDRLAFERILPPSLDKERKLLFSELRDSTDGENNKLQNRMDAVTETPYWQAMDALRQKHFDEHPVVARAERAMLAAQLKQDSLVEIAVIEEPPKAGPIRRALATNDITELMEILR